MVISLLGLDSVIFKSRTRSSTKERLAFHVGAGVDVQEREREVVRAIHPLYDSDGRNGSFFSIRSIRLIRGACSIFVDRTGN